MISLADLWRKSGLESGGRLVPFLYSTCAYLVLVCGGGGGAGSGGGGAAAALAGAPAVALFKCAPILCLVVMVHSHRSLATVEQTRSYSKYIILGLLLSCVGDACLVWPSTLVPGMAAFGAAHIAYLAAFAVTPAPRGAAVALLVYASAGAFTAILTPPASLRFLVPLYAALLASMTWRGLARALPPRPAPHPAPQALGASGVGSALGGLLFLVSDGVLAYSMFNAPVPHKQVLVMVTYYLAQLGIALSATRLPGTPAPARE